MIKQQSFPSNSSFFLFLLLHYLCCLLSDLLHCSDFKTFPAVIGKQETFCLGKKEHLTPAVQLEAKAVLGLLLLLDSPREHVH